MGLSTKVIKQILLLLNFIFAIFGLILIGFGIFVLVSNADNKIDHGEDVAAGLIIALGILILFIAIFGSLAVIHESRTKLIVYIVGLVVLLLIQLVMASMASQGTKDGLSGSVREGFEQLWTEELKEPGALAYYEDWLQCCGVNSTDDYRLIRHDIPKTCCKAHNCQIGTNLYTDGCQKKFETYLAGKMLTFSIVSWLLIIFELIGAILGWLFLSGLINENRRANVSWM